LLGCQTPREAHRCLTSSSLEADEAVANKAAEKWSKENAQTNVTTLMTSLSVQEEVKVSLGPQRFILAKKIEVEGMEA